MGDFLSRTRPGRPCAAASGSCPASAGTRRWTGWRRRAARTSWTRPRQAIAAIDGHQPLPFPDERGGRSWRRLEQAARSGARAGSGGRRHALRGGVPERGRQARVHEESLRILEEIGVRVHGELALPMLAEAARWWMPRRGLVRSRARWSSRACAAPAVVTFGARNPVFDYTVPSGVTRFAMDGTAAFMRDFETGERRYGRKQDTVDAMRVFQACDLAVMGWPPVAANDRPVASRPLHEFAAMLTSPLSTASTSSTGPTGGVPRGHPGGARRRRGAPGNSTGVGRVLPGRAAGARRRDARRIPRAGCLGRAGDRPADARARDHGPGSLLGNIALANAEALSSIVLFGLAHPGGRSSTAAPWGRWTSGPGRSSPGHRRWGSSPRRSRRWAAPTACRRWRRLRDRCARHRPRGLHREAAHHAAVDLGRGRHHRRVRRARRRPDTRPRADPRRQRDGAPRAPHVHGRGRA